MQTEPCFSLSSLEEEILLVIGDRSAYAWKVVRDLNKFDRPTMEAKQGSVYPAIRRLERRGYLQKNKVANKNYYKVTAEGARALQLKDEYRQRLRGMSNDSR